jgi:hypothetical protein
MLEREAREYLFFLSLSLSLTHTYSFVSTHSTHQVREMTVFDTEMDSKIVQWVNAQCRAKSNDWWKRLKKNPEEFCMSKNEFSFQYQHLADVPVRSLLLRVSILAMFNSYLSRVITMLRLKNGGHLIFYSLKEPILDTALELTKGDGGQNVTIELDNFEASRSRDLGLVEVSSCKNIFTQAHGHLHKLNPSILRTQWEHDRVFRVKFKGESGSDAGGVYREGVSRIVDDCFSEHFSLLLLCPNGQHKINVNMDKYVPNPKATDPLAISYFEFLGKMMGVSLRVQLCLPFAFPSIVWKQIVGSKITMSDLESADSMIVQQLNAIRNCQEDGVVDAETFTEHYGSHQRYTYTGSDGEERELLLGGSSKVVTFENRVDYCDRVIKARLHEFDTQISALCRGMATIVPMRAVQLLTWEELEVAVCGSPKVDMDLWKERTKYSGFSGPEDKTIKLFWKAMESFTEDERRGFIRFAWGRSRLPPKHRWMQDFQIQRMPSTTSLPISHTCFFQVELPTYPTLQKMRHGLLTAIHFGMCGILNS